MRAKQIIFRLWIVLLFGTSLCFPQSTAGRQAQIEAHARQAQKFLQENQRDLALKEFQAIVAIDPKNVDALGNIGVLSFFQGNYAEAIPSLRNALKLQPNLWKIQALLGMAEKRSGDNAAAQADLSKAFPNVNVKEQKIKIDAGMELIEMYSGTGDLDKAASVVDVLSGLYSTNPDVLYASYRIHSDLTSQAILALMMEAPKSARMHQLMAHELARQGDTAGAIQHYREAIKIDPELPGLHFELAEMLNISANDQDQQAAVGEYQAALVINKTDEKSECRLGEIAHKNGDLNGSFEHYSRAVQLQPNDPEAAIGLARSLVQMNQLQKAQALLEHALQVDPTSAVGHFHLATLYRQTGRTKDAKHELEEFQKYKDMKEKLRELYHDMRLQPGKQEADDTDARK